MPDVATKFLKTHVFYNGANDANSQSCEERNKSHSCKHFHHAGPTITGLGIETEEFH